jgi:hypothetical protein
VLQSNEGKRAVDLAENYIRLSDSGIFRNFLQEKVAQHRASDPVSVIHYDSLNIRRGETRNIVSFAIQ